LRELIVESGALNEVEQMISARVDEAQRALDSAVIRPEAEACAARARGAGHRPRSLMRQFADASTPSS
jgi:hypothetical protein